MEETSTEEKKFVTSCQITKEVNDVIEQLVKAKAYKSKSDFLRIAIEREIQRN